MAWGTPAAAGASAGNAFPAALASTSAIMFRHLQTTNTIFAIILVVGLFPFLTF